MEKNSFPSLSSLIVRGLGNSISLLNGESRVCVLVYHRILDQSDPLLDSEPDVHAFTWQMELLASCFNVLSLHDAIAAIRTGNVPPRAVCISFDDGYRSTHDVALPILRRLNLTATVFVASGFLDGGNMWNDRIVEAVRLLPHGALDLRSVNIGSFQLTNLTDRKRVLNQLNDACKYLSPLQRLEVIGEIERLAGPVPTSNLMLTREMISNLARHGIEIGGHTVTHPILTKVDDEAARIEVVENKHVLEGLIGKPLRLFAYPNGKIGMDFDQRHVRMVREAGYSAAFTTAIGALSVNDDPMQLPRGRPWDLTPLRFSLRLLSWLAGHDKKVPRSFNGTSKLTKEEQMQNSVLFVAFHFPPLAESSGIQRTLSFCKNMPACGWSGSVLSASPMAYERKSSSQLSQVPSNVPVMRAWSFDAKRHFGVAGRYPAGLALPDRWISWWFFAVPLGLWALRKYKVRVIWTTYPIATAHLVGLTLKYLTGRSWVADFRDPMARPDAPIGTWKHKVFTWIEQNTVQCCDAAVFTTCSARDAYRRRYSALPPQKFHVIENGYEEENFEGAESIVAKSKLLPSDKLTLLHSGLLYADGRDPSAFFAAIAAIKQRGAAKAESLRIVLRAAGDDERLKGLIQHLQIDDIVFVEPPVSYLMALTEMLEADGLLLFQGTPFNTQVPAKIYEYFRARKPIFGLLDPSGESALTLQKAGFESAADIMSAEEIEHALGAFLAQLRAGHAHIASNEVVESSSRLHRAKQLARVFNQLTQ
jgi:peptidoglycan/xylan/chitin deacetylase (PgdA/CDA1 family)